MKEPQWQTLGKNIQLFHSFARMILTQEKLRTLTANEMEIISHIYLSKEQQTPLSITPKGLLEMDKNYQILLKPYIFLKQEMGKENFHNFTQSIEKANLLFKLYKEMGNKNEIL